MVNEERVKIMDDALFKGVETLNTLGLPYFLVGGTLLGIYRDGHLIDYDTDVDVDVKQEDFDKRFETRQEGLEKLKEASGGCHVLYRHQYYTIHYEYDQSRQVLFDIFLIYKKGRKRYRHFYNEEEGRKEREEKSILVWPAYHYDNPETIHYQGEDLTVPGDTEKYIERFFGKKWREPIPNWGWGKADNHYIYKDMENKWDS